MADTLESDTVNALVALKKSKMCVASPTDSQGRPLLRSPSKRIQARLQAQAEAAIENSISLSSESNKTQCRWSRSRKRLKLSGKKCEQPKEAKRKEEEVLATQLNGSLDSLSEPEQVVEQNIHDVKDWFSKQVGLKLAGELRNILKLPKAYKWICHEWFYSSIDRALFSGPNEFQLCLQDMFPWLKQKELTRVQWCKIRRLFGKPRRCSQAFFQEERDALYSRRAKLRLLQQNKSMEYKYLRDMPKDVPVPLVINSRVMAWLHSPQEGLYSGVIDAVDTQNFTYRVTFDRPGLDSRNVPDYEVAGIEQEESVPLSSFIERERCVRLPFASPPRPVVGDLPQLDNDPLLPGSPRKSEIIQHLDNDTSYGGYPVRFLFLLTKLTKILNQKRSLVMTLRELNAEAEKMKSQQKPMESNFQKRFAHVVLELDALNKNLNEHLLGAQQYCKTLAPEYGLEEPRRHPIAVKEHCSGEADGIVTEINHEFTVKNRQVRGLISHLTSLMLQIQALSQNELSSFDFKSLSDAMEDIKNTLEPPNQRIFQNYVEIHVNHIQSGLSRLGNLHAFSVT